MRSLIFCVVAFGFLLAACNNKPKNEVTFTSEDGKDKVRMDMQEVAGASDEMTKKAEELKKLPPLSTEELKALLPENLIGVKRSNFNVNSMMGFAVADAKYEINDTASVKVMIYDCAGEAGSSFYWLNYWTKMNVESQSDDRYSKTIDFAGGKAVESWEKYNDSYTLTYGANGRLLVIVQGEDVTLDLVKDAGRQLHLKVD